MNEFQRQVEKLRRRTNADDLKSVDCGNNRTEKLFHFSTAQIQYASQNGPPTLVAWSDRPIFVSVANQAFSAVGVGIRPKSAAVWAVRPWEKHRFQGNKNQPRSFGTFLEQAKSTVCN